MQQHPWRRHGSLRVLLAGGALGFHLGYTRFPDWQGPVETAQVLAGLVSDPPETPFYIYQVKLWTLLHQICTLLLSGMSEIEVGALDTVAYTPETAPAMHRILRDVYGVDFFDPPAELRGTVEQELAVSRAMFGLDYQTRAFTHIQDVAPLIAESIGNPRAWNQVFNVGADEPLALTDLAVAVAQAMGTEPQVTHLPARTEVQHAHSSHAKVRAIFGERTHVSLPEGLREMAVWVRRHGATETPAFGAIEITKHLPSAWRDQ